MTLSSATSRIAYGTDGVTKTFSFPFKVWRATDIAVYGRNPAGTEAKATLNVDYTIDIVSFPNAGNVVFVTAPPAGNILVIEREQPYVQELDLISTGDFAAENVEAALDKIVAEIQTLRDVVARAPKLPVSSNILDPVLPLLGATNANALVAVNADGDGFAYAAGVTPPSVPVTPFAATLLDDADADAMRGTLGVPAAASLGNLALVSILVASASMDFASTADNAVSAAVTIAIPGARPGDQCFAQAEGTILTTVGAYLDAKCLTNDVVSVYLVNDSGSTFDPVSQVVNVAVLPALV